MKKGTNYLLVLIILVVILMQVIDVKYKVNLFTIGLQMSILYLLSILVVTSDNFSRLLYYTSCTIISLSIGFLVIIPILNYFNVGDNGLSKVLVVITLTVIFVTLNRYIVDYTDIKTND